MEMTSSGKITSSVAKDMGSRGGQAKAANLRLSPARVERELGDLKTPADAERWLRKLTVLAVSGRVAGAVLHGAVRAVEIWLKVREAAASFEAIEGLRADVRKLRDERDRAVRERDLAKNVKVVK